MLCWAKAPPTLPLAKPSSAGRAGAGPARGVSTFVLKFFGLVQLAALSSLGERVDRPGTFLSPGGLGEGVATARDWGIMGRPDGRGNRTRG